MKIKDLPKVDLPREKRARRVKRSCVLCGVSLSITTQPNGGYAGGQYFGTFPLHTKIELRRAMKADTHALRAGATTIRVLNQDPKPYATAEYWECAACAR